MAATAPDITSSYNLTFKEGEGGSVQRALLACLSRGFLEVLRRHLKPHRPNQSIRPGLVAREDWKVGDRPLATAVGGGWGKLCWKWLLGSHIQVTYTVSLSSFVVVLCVVCSWIYTLFTHAVWLNYMCR